MIPAAWIFQNLAHNILGTDRVNCCTLHDDLDNFRSDDLPTHLEFSRHYISEKAKKKKKNVKLSHGLTKHHVMKTYGGVEV
jgi:hypothetical protein